MALLQLDIADRVATITLDDPQRRNALTLKMVDEIVATFDRIDADAGVGAVVITGAAPAFCAGADLSDLAGLEGDAGLRAIYRGFSRVSECPVPVLAAVNGAAVGAGTNLALVSDVRIAGRKARFDTRFLRLGLHPGGGHTWMFQRITGPQAAMAAVLFGEIIDGAEAERVGLAFKCVDDDALLATAHEMAARAAEAPRELVMAIKRTMIDIRAVGTYSDAIERELVTQVWSTEQPFYQERLAAVRAQVQKK
ncbi:MAG: enoyl-CoA hydratase [Acidimicrobiia bacterium]